MKRLMKTLFSIFIALTMATPATALTNPILELNDVTEEEEPRSSEFDAEDYTIMFLRSDFGLSSDRDNMSDQGGNLMMFMTNPDKKMVKDAQVVVTLISQTGVQTMLRASPYKGGYFIQTDSLCPGPHRLEAEIITDGWLLTDQINFQHV